MYAVLATSPASEYVVLAVFATGVDHVILLSADLSILYPVIAEPPLFAGAIHDRLICDDDTVVAERPVGGCGAVTGGACVVADVVFDGELVPTELIAETR